MREEKYDTRHGGPYDRGMADSYYGRSYNPHYYAADTGNSQLITDLTPEENAAYAAGYKDNNDDGNFKDWG